MDQVAQVRNKTDIVALIGSYIPLKKMGNNFKANCPFHSEKTPSFVVSPERQIWHCFGCQKGGDCYSFLMEYEHIEFPEALRILADKAGVVLEQKGFDSNLSSRKETIYKLNHLAAEFYHFLLTKHTVGKKALAYLTNRGIKPQTMKTYMLGFAPSSDNALVRYLLQKKKYTPEEILEAGLATRRMGGLGDFFQGRLIFPLYDHRGNAIGFSGRILDKKEDIAKYINTRETLAYHKGSVFFGLNSSIPSIKKLDQAIIMEGEFDVIAAFQQGITNVVAVKGTALTEDQVHLIARFAKKVTLCFDMDKPGQDAMVRSLPILEKKGLTITAIIIAGSKDPDEAIQADPVSFAKAVKHDRPVYDVLLEQALATFDTRSAQGKKRIGDFFLPHVAHITNEIIKEHYLRLLSKAIDVSPETLIKEMQRLEKKEIVKNETVVPSSAIARSREEVLEEYLVALLVQCANPQPFIASIKQFLQEYSWITQAFGKIIARLEKLSPNQTVKQFVQALPQELVSAYDRCFLLPLPSLKNDEEYAQEVKKLADELYILNIRRQIKTITQEIQIQEKTGNEDKLIALRQMLSPLLTKLTNRQQK